MRIGPCQQVAGDSHEATLTRLGLDPLYLDGVVFMVDLRPVESEELGASKASEQADGERRKHLRIELLSHA